MNGEIIVWSNEWSGLVVAIKASGKCSLIERYLNYHCSDARIFVV
jgi:hypothetical protein